MRKSLFLIAFLLPFFLNASAPANHAQATECPAPTNLTLTAQTGNSVSFDWDDCGCIMPEYHVFYTKSGQTSQEYITGASAITISGLSAGTYQFYFYTVSSTGQSSIIVEEVLLG